MRNKILSKRYSDQQVNNEEKLVLIQPTSIHDDHRSQDPKPKIPQSKPDKFKALVGRKSEASMGAAYGKNEAFSGSALAAPAMDATFKTEVVAAKISATLVSLGNSDGSRNDISKSVRINTKSLKRLNTNAGVFGVSNHNNTE